MERPCAEIQESNQQFRRDGGNGADVQVAHGQRSERLQGIQHELVQLADLGRKVVSKEQMKEKHHPGLHPVKQKRAAWRSRLVEALSGNSHGDSNLGTSIVERHLYVLMVGIEADPAIRKRQ